MEYLEWSIAEEFQHTSNINKNPRQIIGLSKTHTQHDRYQNNKNIVSSEGA